MKKLILITAIATLSMAAHASEFTEVKRDMTTTDYVVSIEKITSKVEHGTVIVKDSHGRCFQDKYILDDIQKTETENGLYVETPSIRKETTKVACPSG